MVTEVFTALNSNAVGSVPYRTRPCILVTFPCTAHDANISVSVSSIVKKMPAVGEGGVGGGGEGGDGAGEGQAASLLMHWPVMLTPPWLHQWQSPGLSNDSHIA